MVLSRDNLTEAARKAQGKRFDWQLLLALICAAVLSGQLTGPAIAQWVVLHTAELLLVLEESLGRHRDDPGCPGQAKGARAADHWPAGGLPDGGQGYHPTLHADIRAFFEHWVGTRAEDDRETYSVQEKGHGRLETRTLTCSSGMQGYLNWPGVQQVMQRSYQGWENIAEALRYAAPVRKAFAFLTETPTRQRQPLYLT